MGARFARARRAGEVGRVARRSGLLRVLREIGAVVLGLYMAWKIVRTPGEL